MEPATALSFLSEAFTVDFERVAIIGPGLLGGSVALALRERIPGVRVTLWARRAEVVEELSQRAVADVVSGSLSEVIGGADLIILATPVGVMKSLAEEMVTAGLRPGAIVTDVGSVKRMVMEETAPIVEGAGHTFVGSHPMAGSEKTGMEHAKANLFVNAACFITPGVAPEDGSVVRVEAFWRALGCWTERIDAPAHDRLVARISHMPHLLAALLSNVALDGGPETARFAGGGLRDSTRISAGPPPMWTEILLENREALLEMLDIYQGKLFEVLAFLRDVDDEGLRRFLEDARQKRRLL